MIRLALLIAAMLAAACGSKPDAYDQVLTEMHALEQRMCACPDRACRQEVGAELAALRASLGARLEGKPKPRAAQERRGRAIEDAIRVCRRAGAGPGRGADRSGDEPGSARAGSGASDPGP